MSKFIFLVLPYCLLSRVAQPQTLPVPEAQISTGTVQVRITAAGPLVAGFYIPQGDSLANAVGEITLWMGAIDVAGNLLLAIQDADTAKSDMRAGFLDLPNSAGVWKVTKAEIEQHQADFADNGVIDKPIPAIFAWPGKGNPYSMQYNGFNVDTFLWKLAAPFSFSTTWPDQYNPANGDYPTFGTVINNIERHPDEIVYIPFHVKQHSALFPGSGLRTPPLACSAVFFAYYCDDADFLDHSIFGYVTVAYPPDEYLDSVFVAFNTDGNIGKPDDDYLGFIPGSSAAYFYNADTTSDDTGAFTPVVALDLINGVTGKYGTTTGLGHVIPLHSDKTYYPAPMTYPHLPGEYYRYLTGHWRDGSPMTVGGSGYGGIEPTDFIFTGAPWEMGEWSEIQAQNPPGDRRALVSAGPGYVNGGYDQVFFALDFIPGDQSFTSQWYTLRSNSYNQSDFFYLDIFPPAINPYDTLPCFQTVSTNPNRILPELRIFPNPLGDVLHLDTGGLGIEILAITDMLGRQLQVRINVVPEAGLIRLNTSFLPAGVYFVHGRLENGKMFTKKIVKQ